MSQSNKIIKFEPNFENTFKKYEQAINKKDYLSACSYFNYLKSFNRPEIYVLQAGVFYKLKRPALEVQCLVDLLKFENYSNYLISYVVNIISKYFSLLSGKDLKKHYLEITKKRMQKSGQLSVLEENKNIELRFVDDIDSAEIIVSARKYIQDNKLTEAKDLLEKVGKKDKNYLNARNMLTFAYMCENNLDKANEIVSEIYKIDPDNVEAMINVLSFSGEEKEVYRETKEKFLSTHRDNLAFSVFKSELLIKDKEFDKAIKVLEMAKKSDFLSEHILFNLARCYFFKKDLKNTLRYLKKLFIIDNTNYLYKHYIRILENSKINEYGDLLYFLKNRLSREFTAKTLELINLTDYQLLDINEEVLEDCLRWTMNLPNLKNMIALSEKLVRTSVGIKVIKRRLTDAITSPDAIYFLIKALIKNMCREEFFVLLNYKLQKIKLKYPSKLLNEFNVTENGWTADNKVDINKFLNAYAETYTYLLYNSMSVENLTNVANFVYGKLENMSSNQKEVFENDLFLAVVIVCLVNKSDVNVLKMISKDYKLSQIAVIKAIRLIEGVL